MVAKISGFISRLGDKLVPMSFKNQWLLQRLSAVLLVPLVIWLGVFFHYGLTASYQEFREWLLGPLSLACFFIFLGVVASHSYLGLKVIIEDYMTDQQLQEKLIFVSLWGFGLLVASAVLAVIILFFRV
ncbi:MAG TPA: succinate dehydrogenase, hydrophobic membrane anchor protein [Methylococcales bacterium]|nr:succinate dehydrogenase, hydrophobic membrane anchor protein [Methylococcales bacterium]